MKENQITITLNEPHKGQQLILDGQKRFNGISCGRRFGKSALAENLLIESSLASMPVAYFAPTYKLLEVTYNDILHSVEPLVLRKNDRQFIELIGGGRIDFWSLENELAGRSRKYKRIIVDEAAFVKNLWKRWTESLRATLSDYKGDAWFLSTPKGKNDFYKICSKGMTNAPGWAYFNMPTLTNPYIDPYEIENAKKDMPEFAFAQEYEAKFLDDALSIFRGIKERVNTNYSKGTRNFIGVDIGRVNDYTVVTVLNDKCQMVFQSSLRKTDWIEIANWVAGIVKKYQSPIVAVESNGVGDPMCELISKSLPNITVYPVFVTGHNKQTLIEDLVVAFDQKNITILDDKELHFELENFTYIFDAKTRKVKYSAPEGLHDDRVMSLAHAYNCFKTKRSYGQY